MTLVQPVVTYMYKTCTSVPIFHGYVHKSYIHTVMYQIQLDTSRKIVNLHMRTCSVLIMWGLLKEQVLLATDTAV